MNKHISSGAVVYKIENDIKKVLLLYRKQGDSWHLPKGTQNAGETLEETALREVKEETGVDIEIIKYIGKLDSSFERDGQIINKETHYFLAQPAANSVIAPHDKEHDKMDFIEVEKALELLDKTALFEKEAEILKKSQNMAY